MSPGCRDRIEGDPDLLEKAAQALGNSKRPLIFVGGGIISSEATAELQELAEMLGSPVIVSQNGRGALSDRHPLALPSIAAYDLLPNADVILAVGTRFVMPGPNPYPTDEGQTVIHVDIDDSELDRNVAPDIGIVADAKAALADLGSACAAPQQVARITGRGDGRRPRHSAGETSVHVARFRVRRCDSQGAAGGGHLRDGSHAGWVTSPIRASRCIPPAAISARGTRARSVTAFNTALGVKVGNPDKPVVAISGDGGFLYGAQELSTAVNYGINLVTVVFNDSAYGNVRRTQDTAFNHRIIASDLHNPDFVKFAESFGAQGRRAETPEQLTTQVEEALKAEAPALIEVPLGVMPNPFQMFSPPPDMMERALALAKQS